MILKKERQMHTECGQRQRSREYQTEPPCQGDHHSTVSGKKTVRRTGRRSPERGAQGGKRPVEGGKLNLRVKVAITARQTCEGGGSPTHAGTGVEGETEPPCQVDHHGTMSTKSL